MFDLLAELPRGILEATMGYFAPDEEQQPPQSCPLIVLLPGLGTHDFYMGHMRDRLKKRGYAATTWGCGTNLGARTVGVNFEKLSMPTDAPLILIGWSLGGVIAQSIHPLYPNVLGVVTLGSPLERLERFTGTPEAEWIRTHRRHARSLSIAASDDGIVRCPADVTVKGCHAGLPFNPQAFEEIAQWLSSFTTATPT